MKLKTRVQPIPPLKNGIFDKYLTRNVQLVTRNRADPECRIKDQTLNGVIYLFMDVPKSTKKWTKGELTVNRRFDNHIKGLGVA